MSSYFPHFSYLNKDSQTDFNWIVASLDPDNGEQDSGMSMEQIYTESYRGTKRILYGTRYDTAPVIKITVVKCNGTDFSIAECRAAYRWLIGNPNASYLDLYVGDELQYSFIGTIQDVKPYKLDARTVALSIYFESISPWAYSDIKTHSCAFDQALDVDSNGVLDFEDNALTFKISDDGVLYSESEKLIIDSTGTTFIDTAVTLPINNDTDDLYSYIYLDTNIANNNSDYVSIKNKTTKDETIIYGMSPYETITLSNNQFIISSISGKTFGNTFNFIWPRLAPGVNEFELYGSGSARITFSYRHPIKIGDCCMNVLDMIDNSDCGCSGGNTGGGGSGGGESGGSCYVDEQALYDMLYTILR